MVGAVGRIENPAALRRWMVTGPEMARLTGKFEVSTKKKKKTDFRHHELTKHAQMTFGRDITSLTGVIEQMGNPFAENSNDLLVLDSRDLADSAVIDTLRQIKYSRARAVGHQRQRAPCQPNKAHYRSDQEK